MFSKGNRLFREGKFDEAVASYEKAIARNPGFYFYHENLGIALERSGRMQQAVAAYRKAISLRPKSLLAAAALRRLGAAPPMCKSAKNWEDPEPVRLLRSVSPRDEEALKAEYRARGLDKVPDTFALYRIIGNDLYPRHARGQSLANVRFILENEPDFPHCSKRWVINRIVDPDERGAIIDLLERHDQRYTELPFDPDEFIDIDWDFSTLPKSGYFSTKEFLSLTDLEQSRAYAAAYRSKNNYVMNNNGARNVALNQGRRDAKWVLPWDGNCFLTTRAWQELAEAVTTAAHLKYFVVPMQRIVDNASLLREDFQPSPLEEPQIVFRTDSGEEFDVRHPYGRRPKVELFWRLKIPGQWDKWRDDQWELPRAETSPEARQFGVAGWVARLASGQASLEAEDKQSFKNRGRVREQAIKTTIHRISRLLSARGDPWNLVGFSYESLERLRRAP